MKRIVSTLLIFIGIVIICYPKLSEYYYTYKQKEIMKKLDLIYKNNIENSEDKTKLKTNNSNLQESNNNSTCTIKIDKINLYQPILQGASQENLSVSIASINTDVKPGQVGNYALAGHRSHTYGRNFNRLAEIEIEDKIKIFDGSQEYVYTVCEKFLVKPEETWVLNSNKVDREITLITCNPMINPTGRLIIKGKIK